MRLTFRAKWVRLSLVVGPDAETEDDEETYITLDSGDLTVVPADEYVYEDDPAEQRGFGFSPRK